MDVQITIFSPVSNIIESIMEYLSIETLRQEKALLGNRK